MQSNASGDMATGSRTIAPAAAGREPWESPWVWGFVVLVGAAVLCRQYFGAISYWYDEAFILFNVYRRPFLALIGAVDCNQAAPVFYLWIERAVYLVLGPSELAMRLPAFLAGLAALLLMVPLARRLVGGPGWPWAVAFCALSAHFVMHSCEVHPYSFDVLACEAVLMAVCFYVTPGYPRRRRGVAAAPLLLAALVLPWFSFPAAFALGAAGTALLTHALGRRSPRDLVVCAVFTGLTFLSGAAMWYFHARYLNYPGLHEFWTAGFPRRFTPGSLLFWTLNTPVEVGNYANQAVGIPMALLGAVGAWVLARRSPPLAVAAVGPIVFGMAAACLKRYPMDDRLLMYAAPCLWLLSAAGVGAVLERFRGRRRWVAAAFFGLLLANGALETAKEIVSVRSRGDWRGAFAYVHEHQARGDKVWVAFPQVYEAYYGDPDDFVGGGNAADMERQALQGPVWVVTVAGHEGTRILVEELEKQGCVRTDFHGVDRIDVYLYTPPPRVVGGATGRRPAGASARDGKQGGILSGTAGDGGNGRGDRVECRPAAGRSQGPSGRGREIFQESGARSRIEV